jgi:hypothetical protein
MLAAVQGPITVNPIGVAGLCRKENTLSQPGLDERIALIIISNVGNITM